MATRDTYKKQTWENLPSENTPISAERLSHMETGIQSAMDNRALKEVYGDDALSLGQQNTIYGGQSAAFGNGNSIASPYSASVGNSNTLEGSGASLAVGAGNKCNGEYSGYSTIVGQGNTVSGVNNGCFGGSNTIQGYQSFAAGQSNTPNGTADICLGNRNSAQGDNNVLIGSSNTSTKNYDFLIGIGNKGEDGYGIALGFGLLPTEYQVVLGQNNEKDSQSILVVGSGSSESNRHNVLTVGRYGGVKIEGDLTNGAGVSLNSLKSAIENMEVVASGGEIAKVFDTKSDLDDWLAVEGNPETLKVGQNIYIRETDTPDYWWDGTDLQELETGTVVIETMTYDETMAVLNAGTEVA